jgi:EmrB/QacA subfamily drug resistance transporter
MYKNSAKILLAVVIAQFMVSLDMSVVNVALPVIRADLGFGAAGLQWVVDAYALLLGGFLLLGGRAADLYGRRRLFLLGLGVFGLASLGGALAQSPGQLVAARAVQGLAAAALTPAALATLTTTFPAGPARARALGVWGAVAGTGGAVGVLVGGLLTEYAGWRWVMLINLPVVVAGLVLVAAVVPADPARRSDRRLDLPGAVLGTSGLGLLVLGVVRTSDQAWTSVTTLGTLAAAVVLLAGFVLVETRVADPMVRFAVLRSRSVAVANAFVFLLFAGQFAAFYFVSLYLQGVLGLGAAATGAAFLPFCFGLIAGTVVATKVSGALRALLVSGGLLAAAGFGWFSLIGPTGSYAAGILGPCLVTSFGLGLCLAPLAGAATAGVAPHEAGMASGLVNSSRQIGGCVGLAVLTTVAEHRTGSGTGGAALTHGYALGLELSGALLLVAALLALTLLPRRGVAPEIVRAAAGASGTIGA